MFVCSLYTCVSILVPFLHVIISIPMEGILLSNGNSIVSKRQAGVEAIIRVERKSTAASVLGIYSGQGVMNIPHV